jgi:hypothetical protein
MEWQIDYSPDDGVVRLTTSGDMTQADILTMARAGLAEVERRGARRVLVDHRKVTLALKVSEIYHLPLKLLDEGLARDLKVATVYSVDSPRKKDFEFYENVCFNLGLKQVTFVDPEAAMRWLLKGAN